MKLKNDRGKKKLIPDFLWMKNAGFKKKPEGF